MVQNWLKSKCIKKQYRTKPFEKLQQGDKIDRFLVKPVKSQNSCNYGSWTHENQPQISNEFDIKRFCRFNSGNVVWQLLPQKKRKTREGALSPEVNMRTVPVVNYQKLDSCCFSAIFPYLFYVASAMPLETITFSLVFCRST